jgi:hypothetical protein
MTTRHEWHHRVLFVLMGGLLALWGWALSPPAAFVWAQEAGRTEGIGAVSSVQGKVLMDHPDPDAPFQAKVTDRLQHHDVIETQEQSRTKVVLQSGSILTVGQNSRIEIIEHDHDPARPERSVTVKLVRGSLRAFVGNAFEAAGSKFEVQTPTGNAVAHSGVFVMWVDKDTTGTANIGTSGAVEFTSGGQTARLAPGEYSHSTKGGMPVPAALIQTAAHPSVHETIAATHLKENVRHEAPKDALREIGAPRAIGLGLGGDQVGDLTKTQNQSSGVDQAQGGGENANSVTQQKQQSSITNHNRTPPSVHSRSSERLLRPNEAAPLRGQDRIRQ